MSEQRCECCEMLPGSCGKQKEADQLARAKKERARLIKKLRKSSINWFPAMWPGVCVAPRCGEPFPEGTYITRNPGGGYVAECCAEGRY